MPLRSLAILALLALAGCRMQTDRRGVALNLTALREAVRHRDEMPPAQIDWLTQALSPAQHNDLGVLYEREGRLDDAVKQYNVAILKDPRLAKAYVNLGNVRRKQGRRQEALLRYREAIALEPGDFAAVNNFADLCAEMGQDRDEATARLSAALRAEPSNPYGLDTLGWLYYLEGQPERALPVLESAVGPAQQDQALSATVHCHLALVCVALGRKRDAAEHARQAKQLGCTPEQAAQLDRALGPARREPGSQ